MAHNQFLWYEYKGRGIKFTSPKAELSLKKNHVFGIRTISDKYYVTDIENKATIRIDVADMHRLVNNSKGFTGEYKKIKLRSGVGALDKKEREEGFVRIDSGMFSRGKYDAKKKTLTLEFRNGAVWQYSNVSAKEVMAFEKAKSQGSYFNEVFKGTKDSQRMESLSSSVSESRYGIFELSDMPARTYYSSGNDTSLYSGDRVSLNLGNNTIHWCVVREQREKTYGENACFDLFVPISADHFVPIYNVPRHALTKIEGPYPIAPDIFASTKPANCVTASVYSEEDLPPSPEELSEDIVEGERVTVNIDGQAIPGCVVESVNVGSGDVGSTFGVFTPILPGAFLRVPKVPLTAITRDTYTAVASAYSVTQHGLYEVCDLPAPPSADECSECNKFARGSRVKIQFDSGIVDKCVVNNYGIDSTIDGEPVFSYSVFIPAGNFYTIVRGIPEHALLPCECAPAPTSLFSMIEKNPATNEPMVSESSDFTKARWRMWQPDDLPPEPAVIKDGDTYNVGARVSLRVMKDGTTLDGCVVLSAYPYFGNWEYVIAAPFAGHFYVQVNNIPSGLLFDSTTSKPMPADIEKFAENQTIR